MPLEGERLDRPTYSFLHTLDEGNSAICRLAYHDIFDSLVVQKTISMLGMADGVAAHEPGILKQVRHDRIVEVWEAQWDPDPRLSKLQAITFVCPYYEGGSIYTALVQPHVFSVKDLISIADDLLCALDYLHVTKRYLHRDVKPGNVMLDGQRKTAFLGDLGSAVQIESPTASTEAHGGSPLYLAPEARLTGLIDARSDLYSLGVTLVEVLNGRFRYEELDESAIDARLDAGRRALPDKDLEPAPWVPSPLAKLVRKLCSKDPAERPLDAATALRTLREIRVVDWIRNSGEGVTGVWTGYWPPNKRRSRQRIYEVRTELIDSGLRNGKIRATARWRKPTGSWRNIAKLTRHIDQTDTALRQFFRLVDAEAQRAPTP